MNETLNIEERKPIWIALSDFYLDTELQESDFRHIAFKIIESPYSLEEVKEINKYEIFPVLQPNLMSVAGEWAGFPENWTTLYIANRAFGGLRKFSAIYQHRQIVDLAFKMNKIKTKYNALAQCKLESLLLSTALLAIY
jgi:hypothetical protein